MNFYEETLLIVQFGNMRFDNAFDASCSDPFVFIVVYEVFMAALAELSSIVS